MRRKFQFMAMIVFMIIVSFTLIWAEGDAPMGYEVIEAYKVTSFLSGELDRPLTPDALVTLQRWADTAKSDPNILIEFRGFTDSTKLGLPPKSENIADYNLGKGRPDFLYDWFFENGVNLPQLVRRLPTRLPCSEPECRKVELRLLHRITAPAETGDEVGIIIGDDSVSVTVGKALPSQVAESNDTVHLEISVSDETTDERPISGLMNVIFQELGIGVLVGSPHVYTVRPAFQLGIDLGNHRVYGRFAGGFHDQSWSWNISVWLRLLETREHFGLDFGLMTDWYRLETGTYKYWGFIIGPGYTTSSFNTPFGQTAVEINIHWNAYTSTFDRIAGDITKAGYDTVTSGVVFKFF
jgi:hypothetical protein